MSLMVKEAVNNLEYDELMKLKQDLDEGGTHLSMLVKQKIKEKENEHKKVCSACQAEIDSNSTASFTLIFGPDDFKKKATFCAVDCMEYFLEQIKAIKKN